MANITTLLNIIKTAVYGRDMRQALHDAIKATNDDTETKEPKLTIGTASQYYRGDKTLRDLQTDVRNTVLTGLSTASNSPVAASSNVLTAFGRLQAQVNTRLPLSGGSMEGDIAMNGHKITSSATPTSDNDLINKSYLNSKLNAQDITYDALKALKDAGGLVTGKKYRITDFRTIYKKRRCIFL